MALNLAGGVAAFATMIENFEKTLGHEVVTQTEDNMSGSEELTYATSVNISGAFFKRTDAWAYDKQGLFENADAILLVAPSISVKKNDKITYNGETYTAGQVIPRLLDGNLFYYAIELFRHA